MRQLGMEWKWKKLLGENILLTNYRKGTQDKLWCVCLWWKSMACSHSRWSSPGYKWAIELPLGLLEIKNPHSKREMTLSEACTTSSFCLREEKGEYKLKRQHDYYHQVQCQLYCVKKAWCDFVVRTGKQIHVERIYRDTVWWSKQLPKLKTFYFDALLPELACPRFGKGTIREPLTRD